MQDKRNGVEKKSDTFKTLDQNQNRVFVKEEAEGLNQAAADLYKTKFFMPIVLMWKVNGQYSCIRHQSILSFIARGQPQTKDCNAV